MTKAPKRKKAKKKPTMADKADPHVLYENSVQCVEAEIDFVDETFKKLRGRKAVSLREDFCGTANTACEWVRRRRANVAIGVDLDAEVLSWGKDHHVAALKKGQQARVELVNDNVIKVDTPPQDVILAMNFSYWILQERKDLKRYFKSVRASLADDGIFFLDSFGGYDAFRELKEHTEYDDYTYTWDQASYNPISGEMQCNIHFKFADGSRLKNAFSYTWRLWTLPEIKDLLAEVGFSDITIYWQGWDEDEEEGNGEFDPVEDADADAGWICYITANK